MAKILFIHLILMVNISSWLFKLFSLLFYPSSTIPFYAMNSIYFVGYKSNKLYCRERWTVALNMSHTNLRLHEVDLIFPYRFIIIGIHALFNTLFNSTFNIGSLDVTEDGCRHHANKYHQQYGEKLKIEKSQKIYIFHFHTKMHQNKLCLCLNYITLVLWGKLWAREGYGLLRFPKERR